MAQPLPALPALSAEGYMGAAAPESVVPGLRHEKLLTQLALAKMESFATANNLTA